MSLCLKCEDPRLAADLIILKLHCETPLSGVNSQELEILDQRDLVCM